MRRRESREEYAVRVERAEDLVSHEWAQFQKVNNDGGRAQCQDDWPTFHQMRISQFLTWPLGLVESYAEDLASADATGRNLVTEKYARMMSTTERERFIREIEPRLPQLTPDRLALQEQAIAIQLDWADDFMRRYPKLGAGMRLLRTEQDTLEETSFETYLRGELATFSDQTMLRYRDMVMAKRAEGENLTEETVRLTVLLGGYDSLDEAEAAQ